MQAAWRIVKARRARTAFDGEGARLYGARWTPVGRPAVYVSSTLALATLELLVHLNDVRPLAAYALFEVAIPDDEIVPIDAVKLPAKWAESPAPAQLQTIGNDWLESGASAVLRVPSAIVKVEFNYVLNPKHRDFGRIKIGPQQPFELDPRLGAQASRR